MKGVLLYRKHTNSGQCEGRFMREKDLNIGPQADVITAPRLT
ncbi:hypothetical protein [Bradyrhizobium sp. SRL28]|nr:hypothetical protein [Bradyrhizobium sp. SRL28]